MESVIIYRPDGVALSYNVGAAAMNQPGEQALGKVSVIDFAEEDDPNDFCKINFEKGVKIFSSMSYVYTKTD